VVTGGSGQAGDAAVRYYDEAMGLDLEPRRHRIL
jgi:hypothetical protein